MLDSGSSGALALEIACSQTLASPLFVLLFSPVFLLRILYREKLNVHFTNLLGIIADIGLNYNIYCSTLIYIFSFEPV